MLSYLKLYLSRARPPRAGAGETGAQRVVTRPSTAGSHMGTWIETVSTGALPVSPEVSGGGRAGQLGPPAASHSPRSQAAGAIGRWAFCDF